MTQLGDSLSDERRKQGKSIVDVEAATRIRGRLIQALEHGDYDLLPAPAYVKGYIQSYAKYLDIPAQPLLEMYKVDVRFADERAEERERMGPLMPRGARYSNASRQNLDDLPAETVVPQRDQQHAIPVRTWLVAAAAILAVFVALWGISRLVASAGTPPPVPRSVQETTAPNPAAANPATVAGTPVSPVEPSAAEPTVTPASADSTAGITPFKLTFRIRPGEKSYLRVTVDGQVAFGGTVERTADFPSLSVYRQAVVLIGKPRWVTTFKNGQRVPTPNQDAEYTLTLKNENAPQ